MTESRLLAVPGETAPPDAAAATADARPAGGPHAVVGAAHQPTFAHVRAVAGRGRSVFASPMGVRTSLDVDAWILTTDIDPD